MNEDIRHDRLYTRLESDPGLVRDDEYAYILERDEESGKYVFSSMAFSVAFDAEGIEVRNRRPEEHFTDTDRHVIDMFEDYYEVDWKK